MKLSVVIPTLDAEAVLAETLAALVPGAVSGLIGELIVCDGGSRDRTAAIADASGARIIVAPRGRGPQLGKGAEAARGDWLLFLHADSVLEPGWEGEVRRHIGSDRRAAVFGYRLDDPGWRARLLEAAVAARTRLLALPYGDQGLLISRGLYDEIGGFRPLPIMEDVDIVRRLGRRRIVVLRARATTGAARYRREGYARRIGRNLLCLALWFAGYAPERIARLYG